MDILFKYWTETSVRDGQPVNESAAYLHLFCKRKSFIGWIETQIFWLGITVSVW